MLTVVAPLPRSSDIEWCKGVELGIELVKLDNLDQATHGNETVPVCWTWWWLRGRRWGVVS